MKSTAGRAVRRYSRASPSQVNPRARRAGLVQPRDPPSTRRPPRPSCSAPAPGRPLRVMDRSRSNRRSWISARAFLDQLVTRFASGTSPPLVSERTWRLVRSEGWPRSSGLALEDHVVLAAPVDVGGHDARAQDGLERAARPSASETPSAAARLRSTLPRGAAACARGSQCRHVQQARACRGMAVSSSRSLHCAERARSRDRR
jgi:hypothetical protein